MPPEKMVYQFKITLKDSDPPIWRTIQVPSTYSFYGLHVAIQDAMGWHDDHLHEFRVQTKTGEDILFKLQLKKRIYTRDETVLPEDKHVISDYEDILSSLFIYRYDFDRNWVHHVKLEKTLVTETNVSYPRCVNGERACPPEDCGGIDDYEDLLYVLADPENENHEDAQEWVETQINGTFDPEHFDPHAVVFKDPELKMKMLLLS